jgi:hypothetical protein
MEVVRRPRKTSPCGQALVQAGKVFKFSAWVALGLIVLPLLVNWGLAGIYSFKYKPLNSGPTPEPVELTKIDIGRDKFESLSIAVDQQMFRVVLGYPRALDGGQKDVDLIYLTLDARGKVLGRTTDTSTTTNDVMKAAENFLHGSTPLCEVLALNHPWFDTSQPVHVRHFWKRAFHHPFRLGSINGQSQDAWSGTAYYVMTIADTTFRFRAPAGVGSYFIDASTALHGAPRLIGDCREGIGSGSKLFFISLDGILYMVASRRS